MEVIWSRDTKITGEVNSHLGATCQSAVKRFTGQLDGKNAVSFLEPAL